MCGGEEGRTRTSHSHHSKVALSPHPRVVENIFTLIQLPLMMMMFDDM